MRAKTFRDCPDLAAELHPTKNVGIIQYGKPINVLDLLIGTHKQLAWICKTCEHHWNSQGDNRVQGKGCPACANKCIHTDGRNSMANTHSELAKEYQGDANLMIAGTNKKLDWICSTCEHMWSAVGNSRVKGKGCPACAGRLHSDGRNSMYNTHPHLAKEYQGNANLIIAGTNDRLPWKCITCEHEWTSLGEGRIQGNGCPACAKTGYDPSKIGYVYIHTYIDDTTNWLKCGITNHPIDRFKKLSRAAKSQGIEVLELDIFKFDDGYVAQQCETALLRMKRIRYDSGYDVDGKSEFFQFDALDKIKNIINKY